MEVYIPAGIAVIFALLITMLLSALIFSGEFRRAVLGGRGEAKIVGVLSVKGVAIVLLLGLLIGALYFALQRLPSTHKEGPLSGPIKMRLNVHFDPEVNINNPEFKVSAFLKVEGGEPKPLKVIHWVSAGALSVEIIDIPKMDAPFFIEFKTPSGIWKTDDHKVCETPATATKQAQIPE